MRAALALSLSLILVAPAAAKRETEFIEQAAVMVSVFPICHQDIDVKSIQIAMGSAMIHEALSKEVVVARVKKRAYFITHDVLQRHAQSAFCGALLYYVKNGYPR